MRKYLLKKDTIDLRDKTFRAATIKNTLPAKIDLRVGCSPIVDQGELGSCTANAIASGLREYLLLQAKQPLTRLSRLFLYYEERALEGTINEDSGAMIRDGMKVLQKTGVCPEADWPYVVSTYADPPTEKDIADAKQFVISEYHRVTSLVLLKAALVEILPVVIGIDVYESFESDAVTKTGIVPIPNPKSEQLLGGHAVLVVGYDDNMVHGRTKGYLIVRNSWGSSWGDQGYFYLPYSYFNKYASDCWTGK